MKHGNLIVRSIALMAVASIVLSGCEKEPASQQGSTGANSQQGATPSVAAQGITPASLIIERKAGRPSAEELKASADHMMSLISGKHEEISPIKVSSDGALAMHPGRGVSSWVEFNTGSLRSMDLYPAVRINAACRENPEAGIVGLTIYTDGSQLGDRILLRREDRPMLRIGLNGAKTLKIELDQGNDSVTCDWFSVGLRSTRN